MAGLRFPTKLQSWQNYALDESVDYLNSDDDTREQAVNHYNAFVIDPWLQSQNATGAQSKGFKAQLKAYVPQWEHGQRIANGTNKERPEVEKPDTIVEGFSKNFSAGFGTSFSDTVSGAGSLSNTIARNFNSESEFGQGAVELGNTWTDAINAEFKTDREGLGYDVARGLGQVAGLIAGSFGTGGVGALAKGAGLLGKAGQIGGRTSNALRSVGAIAPATAIQQKEFIDEYVAKRVETGEDLDIDTLNSLGIASGLIGLLDAIIPGRFLTSKYMDRALDAVKKDPSVLKHAVDGLLIEGGTEAIQKGIYNKVIRDTLIDEDRELIDGALEEGKVGGIVGGIFGALNGFLTPRRAGTFNTGETGEGSLLQQEIADEETALASTVTDRMFGVDLPQSADPRRRESDDAAQQELGARDPAGPDGRQSRQSEREQNTVAKPLNGLGGNEFNDRPEYQEVLIEMEDSFSDLSDAEKTQLIDSLVETRRKSPTGTRGSIVLGKAIRYLQGNSDNFATDSDLLDIMNLIRDTSGRLFSEGGPAVAPVVDDAVDAPPAQLTADALQGLPIDQQLGTDLLDAMSRIVNSPTQTQQLTQLVQAVSNSEGEQLQTNLQILREAVDFIINDQTNVPPTVPPTGEQPSLVDEDGTPVETADEFLARTGGGAALSNANFALPVDYDIDIGTANPQQVLDELNDYLIDGTDEGEARYLAAETALAAAPAATTANAQTQQDIAEAIDRVNDTNAELDGEQLSNEGLEGLDPDADLEVASINGVNDPEVTPRDEDVVIDENPEGVDETSQESAQNALDRPMRIDQDTSPVPAFNSTEEALNDLLHRMSLGEDVDVDIAAIIEMGDATLASDLDKSQLRAIEDHRILTADERKAANEAAIKADNPEGPSAKPSFMQGVVKNNYTRWIKSGGDLQDIERAHKEIDPETSVPLAGVLSHSERFISSLRESDGVVRSGLTDLNRSYREAGMKEVSSADVELIDLALRGGEEHLETLREKHPAIALVIRGMRRRITQNTLKILKQLYRHRTNAIVKSSVKSRLPPQAILANQKILGELTKQINIIKSSIGRYLHRAYLFNSSKEYRDEVMHSEVLQRDARRFIAIHYKSNHPRVTDTLDPAYTTAAEYGNEVQSQVDAVVSDIFNQVTRASRGNNVTNTDAILLQNVSSFKDRIDVPASIRKMLGEIKDPSVNFATTIQQQELYLNSLDYAERMIDTGTRNNWLSDRPDSSKGLTFKINDNGSNPAILLLSGMYGTKELNQGLVDYFNIEHQEGLTKHINALTGIVKLGKTVYSPPTAIRNWLTSLWLIGVHNSFSVKGMGDAFRVSYESLTGKVGEDGSTSRKYYLELLELGVIGDGISHQSLVQMMKDVAVYDMKTSDMFTGTFDQAGANAIKQGGIFKSAQSFQKFAIRMYQSADDFPKIMAFEHYRKLFSKAYGKPIDDPLIMEEAARRVKDTHFTYSKVNQLLKKYRGVPFSAPFISFPAEVARTTKNWVKYLQQDLRSGNATLVRSAMLRGLTATATGWMTQNILAAFGEQFGDVQDDDREFYNEVKSKFEVGTGSVPVWKYDDGTMEVVNMSRYNPYAMFTDAIDIFATHPEEELTRRVVDASFKLIEPFVQKDITYEAVVEAIGAMDSDAARSSEQDTIRFTQILFNTMTPTAILQVVNAYRAYNGEIYDYGSGQKDVVRETLKLAGASSSLFVPLKNLSYSGFAYSTIRQDMGKELKRMAKDVNSFDLINPVPAIAQMEYRAQQVWGYLLKDYEMMKSRGFNDNELEKTLKIKGKNGAGGMLTAEEYRMLTIGAPAPRLEYSTKAMDAYAERVRVFRGESYYQQVVGRLAEIKTKLGY